MSEPPQPIRQPNGPDRAALERAAVDAMLAGRSVREVSETTGLATSRLNVLAKIAGVAERRRQARAARDAEIIAAVRDGREVRLVAAEHGLTSVAVYGICKAAGVPTTKIARLAARAARDAEIVQAVAAGRDIIEVAAEYGLSAQAVRFICAAARTAEARQPAGKPWSRGPEAAGRAARNEAIVAAVGSGHPVFKVAAEHGLRPELVRQICVAAGLQVRTKPSAAALAERNAAIISAVRAGQPRDEIARSHGIHHTTVTQILARAGMTDGRTRLRSADSAARDDAIVAALRRGRTIEAVAAEHGLKPQRVAAIAERSGVRPATASRRRYDENAATALDAVRSGRRPVDVALEHGIAIETLRRMYREAGLEPARSVPARDDNVARDKAIVAAARAGASAAEIAGAHGLGRSRVNQILAAAGVRARRSYADAEERAERDRLIAAALATGASPTKVAAELDLPVGVVAVVAGRLAGTASLRARHEEESARRRAEIIAAIDSGLVPSQIAARLGVTVWLVRSVAQQAGKGGAGWAMHRTHVAARNQAVIEAVHSGRKPADVAREHGLAVSAVYTICQRGRRQAGASRPASGKLGSRDPAG